MLEQLFVRPTMAVLNAAADEASTSTPARVGGHPVRRRRALRRRARLVRGAIWEGREAAQSGLSASLRRPFRRLAKAVIRQVALWSQPYAGDDLLKGGSQGRSTSARSEGDAEKEARRGPP